MIVGNFIFDRVDMEIGNKRKTSSEIYLILTAMIFLIIDLLGFQSIFRQGVNILFTPLVSIGSELGGGVKTTIETVPTIGEIRSERNRLLIENAELKGKLATYLLLEEELHNLQQQYDYYPDLSSRVNASVLSWGYGNIEGNLILNKGAQDGVGYGDVVSVGNIYLGIINEVNNNTSSVLLPTNNRSRMSVLIIPYQENTKSLTKEEVNELVGSNSVQYWGAIALGANGMITLENIPKNSSVKVGDHVIITDEDIPDHYYLGDISRLIVDPADVQIRAIVSQPLLINNVTKVFIDIANE